MSEWIVLAFLFGVLVGTGLTGWLAEKFMAAKFREAGLSRQWRNTDDR